MNHPRFSAATAMKAVRPPRSAANVDGKRAVGGYVQSAPKPMSVVRKCCCRWSILPASAFVLIRVDRQFIRTFFALRCAMETRVLITGCVRLPCAHLSDGENRLEIWKPRFGHNHESRWSEMIHYLLFFSVSQCLRGALLLFVRLIIKTQ